VIRIQPNHISFCSIEAIEDIYGHATKCAKGELYKAVLKPQETAPSIATETYMYIVVVRNVNCRNKTRHGYLRRVINPAFSPASLKQLEETMIKYFDLFISGIAQRAQSNHGLVDLNGWFHNLAFDVETHPKAT